VVQHTNGAVPSVPAERAVTGDTVISVAVFELLASFVQRCRRRVLLVAATPREVS
jgi:hypothetical protein